MVLDTHLDTPSQLSRPGWSILDRHDAAEDQSQVDYPRMVEGGLDGGFWVIYTQQGPVTPEGYTAARDFALNRAVEIREMVARHGDKFELAFRAADAAPIVARRKRVVFQSIENAYPLGEDLTLMPLFYRLGVRMISPAHFANNQFGDSATDPVGKRWNGLSPLGRRMVEEANRLGMILDASHASDEVLDQMISLSKTPVILSHSGADAVFDHPRNVPDDLLRKLAASGGVIQVNAYSSYMIDVPVVPERDAALRALNDRFGPPARRTPEQRRAFAAGRAEVLARWPIPRAGFDDFMKHMLHVLRLVGPDHVGVGADWDGGGGLMEFEDITALPKVTAALQAAGYSEADIGKIWGGNVLRVLGQVETYAAFVAPR